MGTIEVGKRADFTVLSDDVLADGFDPEALLQVRVVATVVGGNVVHGHL
jgi:predicted amidohydrolase YtcJ